MTPDDLRLHLQGMHRAGKRPVAARVFYGEESKLLEVPGGKRTRWAAFVERIWSIAPSWHKIEFLGPRVKGEDERMVLDVVNRDPESPIGSAVGLFGDLAKIADEVAIPAGVSMGQQLAGLAGLVKMFLAGMQVMREQDRVLMQAITTMAIDQGKLYHSRLEGLERTMDKQLQLAFALARRAAKMGASSDGEGESGSMSDEALANFVDAFSTWVKNPNRGREEPGAGDAGSNGHQFK